MNANDEHEHATPHAAIATLRYARDDALRAYRRLTAEMLCVAEQLAQAEIEFAEAEQRAKGAA